MDHHLCSLLVSASGEQAFVHCSLLVPFSYLKGSGFCLNFVTQPYLLGVTLVHREVSASSISMDGMHVCTCLSLVTRARLSTVGCLCYKQGHRGSLLVDVFSFICRPVYDEILQVGLLGSMVSAFMENKLLRQNHLNHKLIRSGASLVA